MLKNRNFQIQESIDTKRLKHPNAPSEKARGFFCNEEDAFAELRESSTFQIYANVRQAALELQDLTLMAKLNAGYMIAQEAKYHVKCLSTLTLYNSQM